MEYAVAGLLVVLLCAIVWIGTKVGKKDGSDGSDSMLLLQKETEALRQELSASLQNNLTTVNQSLQNNLTSVNQSIQTSLSTVNQSLQDNLSNVNKQLSQTASQVAEQLKSVTMQVQTSTGQINQRMDNAAKVVGEVKRSLGELGKATEQVFEVGKDIASLQQILKAPKLRGELGEFFLGDLLAQILPAANFELQYSFKTGARVDAVIKLSNGLVPVDSKFPLENFKKFIEATSDKEKNQAKRGFVKDVKNRIDEIADSYILPDEGTFDFALMYIPAENVYYETIIKDDAFEGDKLIASYAFSKRVVPVSPNSFYAYLQTILLGLQGLEISKQAQSILSHLSALNNDFNRFAEDFDVLGGHIGKARSKHEDARKKLDRFGEKLSGLTKSPEEDSDTDALEVGAQGELPP